MGFPELYTARGKHINDKNLSIHLAWKKPRSGCLVWLWFGLVGFSFLLFLIMFLTVQSLSPSLFPARPSPTVPHPIPPSHCLQEMVSPFPTSTPHPTRPPHSPGLGASSLTEARPGHPRLYMSALVSRGLSTPSSASCLHAPLPWGDCSPRVF